MSTKLTIEFATVEDLAWFQRAVQLQLMNRDTRIIGSTVGIALDALRCAKGFESPLTETQAQKIRLGPITEA